MGTAAIWGKYNITLRYNVIYRELIFYTILINSK